MNLSLEIVWSIVALVFGTASVAVREVSRTRLAEALKRVGRDNRLEQYDRHEHDYEVTALIYRQLATVLFVITTSVELRSARPEILQPLYVLGISGAWFLLFGIAIPTAWARHAGESFIARMLGFLEGSRQITQPLLLIVRGVDEIVRRLVGAPKNSTDPLEEIEQEILDVVSQAETTGAMDETEKHMIKSAMILDETSVAEIMTPRTNIIGLDATASYAEAQALALSKKHSRIPVYEETLDHVVGVLHARDLLGVANLADFSLRCIMRPATFIPETKDLASLLREFQTNRVHLAIVVDEYGGTAGLVTIEDILEELVGEIADEHEKPFTPAIKRIDSRTTEIEARMRVAEVNENLGVNIPEDEAYDTIGGYVFSKLGRIPATGENFDADGVRLEVLEAGPRSISRLRLIVLPQSA